MILKKTLNEYLIILGLFETASITLEYSPDYYFPLTINEFEHLRELYYRRHKVQNRR